VFGVAVQVGDMEMDVLLGVGLEVRVNDARPTCAMILKGPRFFSDNFLEGRVVRSERP